MLSQFLKVLAAGCQVGRCNTILQRPDRVVSLVDQRLNTFVLVGNRVWHVRRDGSLSHADRGVAVDIAHVHRVLGLRPFATSLCHQIKIRTEGLHVKSKPDDIGDEAPLLIELGDRKVHLVANIFADDHIDSNRLGRIESFGEAVEQRFESLFPLFLQCGTGAQFHQVFEIRF